MSAWGPANLTANLTVRDFAGRDRALAMPPSSGPNYDEFESVAATGATVKLLAACRPSTHPPVISGLLARCN